MQVVWDGETYEVAVKKKRTSKMKLSVVKGGKVVAAVPPDSTKEDVQQFLDQKAEWIAKTVQNAQNTVKKQRTTKEQGTTPARGDIEEAASSSVSADSKESSSYAVDVDGEKITYRIGSCDVARRITTHVLAPLQVAVMVPPGTPEEEADAYLKQSLPSIRDDLHPRGLHRASKAWTADFPFINILHVSDEDLVWNGDLYVYASRKDVPDYTYKAVGSDEVYVYVPWYVPEEDVEADIHERGAEMMNVVCEYAYRTGNVPAGFKDVWMERINAGDVSYDIEIQRSTEPDSQLYTLPTGTAILKVPWAVSEQMVQKALQANAEELVEQIAQARNEACEDLFGEDGYFEFLGDDLPVEFVPDASEFVDQDSDSIIVHAPDEDTALSVFDTWLRSTLHSMLQSAVDEWLPVVRPEGIPDVTFSVQNLQNTWTDTITATRDMRFDISLVMRPREATEFIVLEQLVCMIPDRSHEWKTAFLKKHMPNWRECVQYLN